MVETIDLLRKTKLRLQLILHIYKVSALAEVRNKNSKSNLTPNYVKKPIL